MSGVKLADAQNGKKIQIRLQKQIRVVIQKVVSNKKKNKKNKQSKFRTTKKYPEISQAPDVDVDEFAPDSDAGVECFDSCYPNTTYLDKTGEILDPAQYGLFVDNVCKKTFLFGSKKVTWKDNWKMCCSIGMMPLVFESVEELDCFRGVLENNVPQLIGKFYWTGGFKNQLTTFYSWCAKDSPHNIDQDIFSLSLEPPNKNEKDLKCLHVFFNKEESDVKVTRSPCNTDNIFLACASVKKLTPDILPGATCRAKCSAQNCYKDVFIKFRVKIGFTNDFCCYKKRKVLVSNSKEELQLKEQYRHGRWTPRNGHYYFFSRTSKNMEEARKTCCSFGAKLLSVKTVERIRGLRNALRDGPDLVGDYWTSGTDTGCEGNFRWCSVDRAFLKEVVQWAEGQPEEKKGNCVTISLTREVVGELSTENCEAHKKFICVVRQSGTMEQALRNECAKFLGLAAGEVAMLNNAELYNYKMKCYLKCVGDGLGMFKEDIFDDHKTNDLMNNRHSGIGITKMSEALAGTEWCKNETKSDIDVCENAFKFYKCGLKKARIAFNILSDWTEAN